MRTIPLSVGEPAPWFTAECTSNPTFHFDTVAGRHVVLCFFGSAADPASQRVLNDINKRRDRFDDVNVAFFGVSTDPEDKQLARVRSIIPGIRFFWDFDRNISRLYGAIPSNPENTASADACRRMTYVLDTRLRTMAVFRFDGHTHEHVSQLMQFLDNLPSVEPASPATNHAPVLVAPRIFEPDLCHQLIEVYRRHGGEDSGFMRDVEGKTVPIIDYGHKRRRDYYIEDESICRLCMVRIHDRLIPEIHKAFQFRATRMERYMVGCYDSATRCHFRRHRDNTTKGTAHRRFAVSINLNPDEYEGGDVRFPEFGSQLYRAPLGGALVFSCSLLHEVTEITKGRRYAFLPFLYDEDAARIREQNRGFLASHVDEPTRNHAVAEFACGANAT